MDTFHIVSLEILSLPSEVATLLFEMADAASGMRLCLSNRKLRDFIDTNNSYWQKKLELVRMDVKSLGLTLNVKARFVAAVSARRNLLDATYFNETLIEKAESDEIIPSIQSGATFAVLSHQKAGNGPYSAIVINHSSTVDFSQWPRYSINNLADPPSLLAPIEHVIVGTNSYPYFSYSPPGSHPTELFDLTPVLRGDLSTAQHVRFITPPPVVETARWIQVASSDANLNRIAYYARLEAKNWVFCVYDVVSDRWSEMLMTSLVPPSVQSSLDPLFNGEHLVLCRKASLVVVRFDKTTLVPKLIFDGESGLPCMFASCIGSEYLIIAYSTMEHSKVSKIRWADLEGLQPGQDLSGAGNTFEIPYIYMPPWNTCNLSTHGSMLALWYDRIVMIIDLYEAKILRQYKYAVELDVVKLIRFVDSTLFIGFGNRVVFAVDFLGRQAPEQLTHFHLRRLL